MKKTTGRGRYFSAAFLAPLIWGFMSIPVRWIKNYPAEDILYYRILVALFLLGIGTLLFRRQALRQDLALYKQLSLVEKRTAIRLVLLASALIFANWFTYIYTINAISIQAAAFAYLICPLITAIFAFLILKEKLSHLKKWALALALLSATMLATGSLTDTLWSIIIAAPFALYLIIQRVSKSFDKLNTLALQLCICALFVIPRLFINQHTIPTDPFFWGSITLIAVVFTIIPLFFSMYALTGISSTTSGILLYVNPIIAFSLAVLYFNEAVDPHKFLAYGLILLAILLFNGAVIKKIKPFYWFTSLFTNK